MPEGLAVNDLRTLMDVVGAGREDQPTPGLPWAVIDGLRRLIGCDAISLCELDLRRRNCLLLQGMDDDQPALWDDFGDDSDDPFWELARTFPPCAFHPNGGDLTSVIKWSDFYTLNELHQTRFWREYASLADAKYSMIAAMPMAPGCARRILIWRDDGSDFGERERLLVQLLRPHLYEVYLENQRRRRGIPQLSARELEVLRLAAQGHGNADIARRLFIAVSTVRKHLEHIFDRTGVHTRAEAAALVIPHLSVVDPH